MRTNKLYANLSKCIFGVDEIPFLGCSIGKRVLRADPAKVETKVNWPVLRTKRICASGLALPITYISFSDNYADMAWPLSSLLKKDVCGAGLTPKMRPLDL